MIAICVVPIEGVLALGANLKEAQPTKWARNLYDSLHTQYRMIAFTQADPELAHWWLRREMLRDWAAVMTMPDHMVDFNTWKVEQVNDFLAEGWDMGMVIDVEREPLEQLSQMGVMTLLMCYPLNKPGWKDPTVPPRPWSDLADTI